MATTTAVAFTATAAFATVFMTVIVAMTAAATVVIVVMIVRAVNVAMSQFFFGRFANRHNFNVEFQVLTGQHVVTINHDVIVFNSSDLVNVGKIEKVNPQIILDTFEKGYIPVVSSVAKAIDKQGTYNINADLAASELATLKPCV